MCERAGRLGRRSLVGMLLAYAGLTVAVVGASTVHGCLGRTLGPRATGQEQPTPPELVVFLGPIAAGAEIDGWTVGEVGPLRNGNLRVELRAGGERVALTLTRGEAGRAGAIAETARMALYPAVHDLATFTPTASTRAAATALAGALAAREAAAEVPEVLLPLH